MKFLLSSALVLSTALLCVAQPSPTPEATVRARFDAFASAFQKADADILTMMLTDDYVHTGPTGSVSTKTQWLDWIRSRRAEIEAGAFRFDSYEMVDVSVLMHGDAAVITGLNVAAGVRAGEPFTHRIRFTNVWVKQDGVWIRAAFHDSINN